MIHSINPMQPTQANARVADLYRWNNYAALRWLLRWILHALQVVKFLSVSHGRVARGNLTLALSQIRT